jgi:hypothetical protein
VPAAALEAQRKRRLPARASAMAAAEYHLAGADGRRPARAGCPHESGRALVAVSHARHPHPAFRTHDNNTMHKNKQTLVNKSRAVAVSEAAT